MKVVIYSDGGADPNPGIGGWAAVLRYGAHEKVLTGNAPQATNNQMELQAAIGALSALTRPAEVTFHTDSEYVRRGITEWIEGWAAKGWKRKGGKPIPNKELWQALWSLVKQHQIDWKWVKGHAGNPMNERVDQLARRARLEITPGAQLDENTPRLYIRGSCKGNPGPGGWGAVLESFEETDTVGAGEERGVVTEQLSGGADHTTNNRMELEGAIAGLGLLPPGTAVQLFTTSDYVFQGATRWIHGWRKRNWRKKDGRPVSNGDLWQALDRLRAEYDIHWVSAKGQTNVVGLEEAGRLARAAIDGT